MSKKITAFLLIFSFLLPFAGAEKAYALSEKSVSAPSAILIEPESGKILYEKNSHEVRACASITKIMTVLLVMEEIEKGSLSLDDEVVTSEHAKSMGGSDIWLEVGEVMTVDEMLKATLVASANDAAVALAEKVCGSEEDFVARMNKRAKQLGMNDTTFKNCNGLDEDGHLTSSYDVALMSVELIKHKKVFRYTTIWLDTLRGGETQIVNTNKLLKTYDGMKGLKTGTTSGAGSCFSAYAERGGISFVAVVLGCDSGTERFRDTSVLLDYGFASYKSVDLNLKQKLSPIKVKNGMVSSVAVKAEMAKSVVLPKGDSEPLYTVKMKKEISAPVRKGEKVGDVYVKSGGETVGRFDIVTKASAEKSSFSANFRYVWRSLIKL